VVFDVAISSQSSGLDSSFIHSEYSVALTDLSHVKVDERSPELDGVISIKLNANGGSTGATGGFTGGFTGAVVDSNEPPDPHPHNITVKNNGNIVLFDIDIRDSFLLKL